MILQSLFAIFQKGFPVEPQIHSPTRYIGDNTGTQRPGNGQNGSQIVHNQSWDQGSQIQYNGNFFASTKDSTEFGQGYTFSSLLMDRHSVHIPGVKHLTNDMPRDKGFHRIGKKHGHGQERTTGIGHDGIDVKIFQDIAARIVQKAQVSKNAHTQTENSRQGDGPKRDLGPSFGGLVFEGISQQQCRMLHRHGKTHDSKSNKESFVGPIVFQDIAQASILLQRTGNGGKQNDKDHEQDVGGDTQDGRVRKIGNIPEKREWQNDNERRQGHDEFRFPKIALTVLVGRSENDGDRIFNDE